MNITLIDNGKTPDAALNASLLFWLPPDSPYGNMQLKLMKLVLRLDEANRRINESWAFWKVSIPEEKIHNAYARHTYATEQAIYLIRRATDELIALIWCLSEKDKTGTYPLKIKGDCIGFTLNLQDTARLDLFKKHQEFLNPLNEVSNAYKHSFVHSEITLIGQHEPLVNTLGLDHNELSAGVKFHNIPLSALVTEFNAFYKDALSWLREYSEKNRPKADDTSDPKSQKLFDPLEPH